MATVQNIINRASAKVNGEFETVAAGTEDFTTYLNILNEAMETWAHWPYVTWQSLYNPDYRLPDPVAAGTYSYAVAEAQEIRVANTPFDNVFIMNEDVIVKRYKMVDQAMFESLENGYVCALFGDTLYFKKLDDDFDGYEIRLPAYVMPPTYTSASTEVAIDSVPWLVAYMAAMACDASPVPFISRNADKFYKQADILMKEMKANNRHRQYLTVKRTGSDRGYSSLSEAIDAGVGVGGLNGIDGGSFD